jgi:hypothetical protein
MTRKAPPRRSHPSAAKSSKPEKKKNIIKPDHKPVAKKDAVRVEMPAKDKKGIKLKEVAREKVKTSDKAKVKGKMAEPGVPKVKKARAKKLPPRMRVRWCVYDAMMKPVALFDYNKKAEAQASLAAYLEKKPNYFLQLVKELLPLPTEEPVAKSK